VGALVNNAGVGLFGETVSQAEGKEAADLRSMLEVNIVALTELCAVFGRDMATRGSGSILNVASMVALMPVPYFAAYAASKAYVRSFSASLRAELRGKGVTVSCLYPGYVKTNFDAASHADNEAYKRMSEKAGMAPEKVALIAARLLESGKANRVAGAVNSIAAGLIGFMPKGFIARVTYGYMKRLLARG
jgi:short-subunit dehydrogenase